MVPGQRPPDGQGVLQLRDHRAAGEDRGRQRPAARAPRPRRAAGPRGTGTPRTSRRATSTTASVGDYELRTGRRTRAAGCRSSTPSTTKQTAPQRTAHQRRSLALQAEHDRLLREQVRRLPVRGLRLDRRRRQRGLRPRDPDPAGVLPGGKGGHGGPRAGPPVVRQLGQPRALAGHLAQRGLGDLRAVAVDRAQRRHLGAGQPSRTVMRHPRRRRLLGRDHRRPRSAGPVRRPGVRPGGRDPARAAPQGGRRGLLRGRPDVAGDSTTTAPAPRRTSRPSTRRCPARTSDRSSTPGSARPSKPPAP